MPPEAIAPAPKPTAPAPAPKPPTPAPAPTRPVEGGGAVGDGGAAPAPQTAGERATAAIRAVLDKKPQAKPGAAQAPAGGDDAELEGVIKTNPKAWKTFEAVKKSFATQKAELEAKIKALESKPAPTTVDDAKLKQMEAKLAEMEGQSKSQQQRLAEYDIRNSEEFKREFVQPWQSTYKEGLSFIAGLQIMNEDGEAVRQATQADFEHIRAIAPQQRRAEAAKMFGDSGADVLDIVKELDRITKRANDEVAKGSSSYETVQAERKAKEAEKAKQFGQFRTDAETELSKQFPEYFSVDHYKDNPELMGHLQDGYDFVDKAAERQGDMTPDELAAATAVIRARAAAFPLLYTKMAAMQKELEEHKAELAKLRGADPGAGKIADGGAGGGDETVGGISDMASKFNE